jgi:dTDP-4-dehydrorhamnose reductase
VAADRLRCCAAVVSPTYVPDLVNACLDLAVDGASGIWHLANAGVCSWGELARAAAAAGRLPPAEIDEVPPHAMDWTAPRPAYSALTSLYGAMLPPLEDALVRYHDDRARYLGGRS